MGTLLPVTLAVNTTASSTVPGDGVALRVTLIGTAGFTTTDVDVEPETPSVLVTVTITVTVPATSRHA